MAGSSCSGGNGMGKSTLLQAIAIALVGPLAGQRLSQSRMAGCARGYDSGLFRKSRLPRASGDHSQQASRARSLTQRRSLSRDDEEVEVDRRQYDQPQLVHLVEEKTRRSLMSGPYAAKSPGWFSCGYGPFRRLLGGASEESSLDVLPGRESRFVTLFREAAALTQCTEWLPNLYSRSIDPHHPEREHAQRGALDAAQRIVNDLLPGQVRISKVDTNGSIPGRRRGRSGGPRTERRLPEFPGARHRCPEATGAVGRATFPP